MDRIEMLKIADRLYKRKVMSKELLSEFVVEPTHFSLYITKEDYKNITGEDWTPPVD